MPIVRRLLSVLRAGFHPHALGLRILDGVLYAHGSGIAPVVGLLSYGMVARTAGRGKRRAVGKT